MKQNDYSIEIRGGQACTADRPFSVFLTLSDTEKHQKAAALRCGRLNIGVCPYMVLYGFYNNFLSAVLQDFFRNPPGAYRVASRTAVFDFAQHTCTSAKPALNSSAASFATVSGVNV